MNILTILNGFHIREWESPPPPPLLELLSQRIIGKERELRKAKATQTIEIGNYLGLFFFLTFHFEFYSRAWTEQKPNLSLVLLSFFPFRVLNLQSRYTSGASVPGTSTVRWRKEVPNCWENSSRLRRGRVVFVRHPLLALHWINVNSIYCI